MMRSTKVMCVVLLATAFIDSPSVVRASAAEVECADVFLPVALTEGGAKTDLVYGLLCQPTLSLPGTIQVLVSGATEGGPAYWDFPRPDFYRADPGTWRPVRARYSYASYLAERGYASLALDRIGTGRSTHPPASEVTIGSNAFVVFQVIQALRQGAFPGGVRYQTVIAAGHSLGAVVLFAEAAEFGQIDGLIAQGFRHHMTPTFAAFPTTLEPARPPGYFTTRPGTRKDFFFYPPFSEPSVIEHEEATKDTVTAGEAATIGAAMDLSKEVTVPVLSIVGQFDPFFCSQPDCPEASQQPEVNSYPRACSFEAPLVENAAHAINLHTNSREAAFPGMVDWLERHFGTGRTPCPA